MDRRADDERIYAVRARRKRRAYGLPFCAAVLGAIEHLSRLVSAREQCLAVGVAEIDAHEVDMDDVSELLENVPVVSRLVDAPVGAVDAGLPEPLGVARVVDDGGRSVGDGHRPVSHAELIPALAA